MSKKNDFNLFEEWARGIMYRGGEEMDDFLSGYGTCSESSSWSYFSLGLSSETD